MHPCDPTSSEHPDTATCSLTLELLGRRLALQCEDPEIAHCIASTYQHMLIDHEASAMNYRVGRRADGDGLFIDRVGLDTLQTNDLAEFIPLFNGEITIRSQTLRPDLYFLHAAAVELKGKALLLVAEVGGGKSTTTWALLHHGFAYLSDELAPLDLQSMSVKPFPRALCLKNDPPKCHPVPESTLRIGDTVQICPADLPCEILDSSIPLAAIFFLDRRSDTAEPEIRELSSAEAGVRVYANALNPLAHPEEGLDAALVIAEHAACFALRVGDLTRTSAQIRSTVLQHLVP